MIVHWKPMPKQELALKSNADEILYGGARGGGKTDAGMAWLLYNIKHSLFRGLVIRKNFTDLSDWIDRAKRMYQPAGGKLVGDTFIFPSGARIRTGHLADADAYQKYQGHEYQNELLEELTHIAREGDYEKLRASCRSTIPEIKPQVFATTNPDGPGSEWVKNRWNIPDRPTESVYTEVPTESGVLTRLFVPSTVYDNVVLMETDPKYIQQLESLQDEELKRAWLHGSWEGFGVEGAYYRAQLQRAEEEGRITTVPYDEMLDVHTWCDLGIADSFSIGYFQVANNQWRWIDYDEFEGESLGYAIQTMRDKKYRYGEHYAPHDIEVRELGSGKSRWEIARDLGVRYNVVPRLPVSDGINAVRMRFATLWVDRDKCEKGLKALRNYQKEFDEKRGVYKDKPLHNWASHGADMIRYWATTNFFVQDERDLYQVQQNRNRNFSMR